MANTGHEIRFEQSDISARPTVLTGAAIFVGVLIVTGVVWGVLWAYVRYRTEAVLTPTPAEQGYHAVPPYPRLQESPHADLQQFRAAQEWQLHHYGWVNEKNGVVRIPIDRAMDLLAQRGIPPQKAPPDLKLTVPAAGTRETGFEDKVAPEPR